MRRSLALILWYSRLAALLPGTMIRYPSRSPNTLSVVSSRKLPWRLPSSGPWQAKQASERMGRTSRLKSTGFSGGFDGVCQAPSGGRHNTIAVAGSHRQMIGRIKDPPRPIEIAQPRIPYYVGVLLWKYLQLRSTPASIPYRFTRAHAKSWAGSLSHFSIGVALAWRNQCQDTPGQA